MYQMWEGIDDSVGDIKKLMLKKLILSKKLFVFENISYLVMYENILKFRSIKTLILTNTFFLNKERDLK